MAVRDASRYNECYYEVLRNTTSTTIVTMSHCEIPRVVLQSTTNCPTSHDEVLREAYGTTSCFL